MVQEPFWVQTKTKRDSIFQGLCLARYFTKSSNNRVYAVENALQDVI